MIKPIFVLSLTAVALISGCQSDSKSEEKVEFTHIHGLGFTAVGIQTCRAIMKTHLVL